MRTIKVFSTKLKKIEKVQVDESVTTWIELQAALNEANIDYSNMTVRIKETEVTLESDNAKLPEGEFTLFLFPQKVKSGAAINAASATHAELRSFIKNERAKKGDAGKEAKAHFGDYTHMTTDQLRNRVASWNGSKPVSKTKKVTEKVIEKVTEEKVDLIEEDIDEIVGEIETFGSKLFSGIKRLAVAIKNLGNTEEKLARIKAMEEEELRKAEIKRLEEEEKAAEAKELAELTAAANEMNNRC